MKTFKTILVYSLLGIFFAIQANGQSLADVLSSIQERKLLLEQRDRLEDYLWDLSLNNTTATYLGPDLIDWDGFSTFPTDAELSGASIEACLELANKAVVEFDSLKANFLNVNEDRLVEAATVQGIDLGQARPYGEYDLPSPGLVTPSNYRSKILELAAKVFSLQAVTWYGLVDFEELKGQGGGDSSSPPTAIDEVVVGATFQQAGEQVRTSWMDIGTVEGRYSPNANPASFIAVGELRYGQELTFRKSPSGWSQSVDGSLLVIERRRYSTASSLTIASAELVPQLESYRVIREFGNEGDDLALRDYTGFEVQGSWEASPDGSGPGQIFVPTGCDENDNHADENYSALFGTSGLIFDWLFYHCENAFVFVPEFSQGLERPGHTGLNRLHTLPPATLPDGELAVNPAPGILFAIDLGKGLDGGVGGSLGVYHPGLLDRDPWLDLGKSGFPTYGSEDQYDVGYPAMSSDLRLIGAEKDFAVFYEGTNSSPPAWERGIDEEHKDWFVESFLGAWKQPRLRQIVGATLLADISHSTNRFGYTISLYRRLPSDAFSFPVAPISPSGLPLLATYQVGPDGVVGSDGIPENYYSLKIERDAGEEWIFTAGGNDPHNFTITWKEGGATVLTRTLVADDTTKTIQIVDTENGIQLQDLTILKGDISYPQINFGGVPAYGFTGHPDNVLDSHFPEVSFTWNSGGSSLVHAYSPSARYPDSLGITDPVNPDSSYTWSKGIPILAQSGPWKTVYSTSSGDLLALNQLNDNTYGKTWTTWADTGQTQTVVSAPDGGVSGKGDAANLTVAVEYYAADDTLSSAVPWMPKLVTESGNTGSVFSYAAGDGLETTVQTGLLSGGQVVNGTKTIVELSETGFPSQYSVQEIGGVTYGSQSWGEVNSWGAPTEVVSQLQNLTSSWTFEGNRLRLSQSETPFGVQTSYTDYDLLSRPTDYLWNGSSGSLSYNTSGLGWDNSLTMTGLGNRGASRSYDGFGNLTGGTEGSGRPLSFTRNQANGQVGVTLTEGGSGRSISQTFREGDGSIVSTTGSSTVAQSGSALSVQNGLLVESSTIDDLAAASTVKTDAWGRVREVSAPDSGGGTETTSYSYSNPGPLGRVTVTHPSGRVRVEESEPYHTSGAVQRWGWKQSGSGSLGSGDRYWESRTTATGGVIETTLFQNEPGGLREVLRSSQNPVTGVSTTTVNEGETTLTSTPSYEAATTIKTTSSEGWSRTATLNNLGQLDSLTTGGTGSPSVLMDPTLRADGSLEQLVLDAGAGAMTLGLGTDGRLTFLQTPELGTVSVNHQFWNGGDDLTINGNRLAVSGDGLEVQQSGEGVFDHGRTTALSAGTMTETIDPVGSGLANVTVTSNAAGAATGKDYALGGDPATTWRDGGMVDQATSGRGLLTDLQYSDEGGGDQFADLKQVSHPAATSGPFSLAALTEDFTFDVAGRLDLMTDASGTQDLVYVNGRLTETIYTAGELVGYTVRRLYGDGTGRQTGLEVVKDGAVVHSLTYGYNGSSRELASISSPAVATYTRDNGAATGPRLITSLARGTVTESYGRDTAKGGRLTQISSNVSGAPSWQYTFFDGQGRRTTGVTNQGNWTWGYSDGQLTSATMGGGFGSYGYGYDSSGKRASYQKPGEPLLNPQVNNLGQMEVLPHHQQYDLVIGADEDAELWVNGIQQPNPTFPFAFSKTTFPAAGGWEEWNVLTTLPGEGEPGAHPDAEAAAKGLLWIPPVTEDMVFDADGNCQSTALWDFGWDGRGRMCAARTKDWDTGPKGYDLSFNYDAQGRRFKKTVNEYAGGNLVARKTVWFVWDGWDLVYEKHVNPLGQTLLERKYTWGLDLSGTRGGAGGAGGLVSIAETTGSGASSSMRIVFPLYDGSGNVVGLSDDAGNLLAEYWWGPFGEKLEATGELAESNPWRFATKYRDEETGLYYFGHRYYDPTTGTWLSREPLGESESLNLYAYCHNDPVNKVDALGLNAIRFDRSMSDDQIAGLYLRGMLGAGDEEDARLMDEALVRAGVLAPLAERQHLQNLAEFEQAFLAFWASEEIRLSNIPVHEVPISPGQQYINSIITVGSSIQHSAPQSVVDMQATMFTLPMAPEVALLKGGAATFGVSRIMAGGVGLNRARAIYGVGSQLRRGSMLSTSGAQFWSASITRSFLASREFAGLSPRVRLAALAEAPKTTPTSTALTKYWPDNNGFTGEVGEAFLYKGQKIDRYGGGDWSRFFSPQGTPDFARALPPGTAGQQLRTFEVMKPFPVQSGQVAPAFGQSGGGTQLLSPVKLETLLNRGILKEVGP